MDRILLIVQFGLLGYVIVNAIKRHQVARTNIKGADIKEQLVMGLIAFALTLWEVALYGLVIYTIYETILLLA